MSYEQYGPVAVQAAQSAGIDPTVFVRQINQESGFNPSAGSPAGAQGIAQFMPETASAIGIDPNDPVQALYGAAHLMRTYLDEFGNYQDALVAYNAGPGAVGGPLPAETQQYLGNILGNGAAMATTTSGGGVGAPQQAPGDFWSWLKNAWNGPPNPNQPSDQPQITQEQVDQYMASLGYVPTGSSIGGLRSFRTPDGRLVGEQQARNEVFGYDETTASGGTVHHEPNVAKPLTSTGAAGFSLSPGQSRYDANGNLIASAPSVNPNDPYAMEKIQNDRTALALQLQAAQFNQNKYNFEMAQGLRKEANDTQQQLFANQLQIAQLQNQISTNIGTLAANPGDLGKYVGTTLAMSRAQQAAAPKQGAYITDQSLAPLGSLLDLQHNLPQPPPPQPVPAYQPLPTQDIRSLLGTIPSAQPSATTPAQSVMGAIAPPYNPQTPDAVPNATGSVGNPAAATNQQPLPAAANGGLEHSAYISGEDGPELNIPTKSGAVVLNQDQMAALGINLKGLMKMADGGIFDVTPQKPQPEARNFVSDLAARLSNNLGLGGRAPGAVFAASPAVSPYAAQAYGQLQQAYSGEPATQYEWLANLLRPQGVNENVIRRSA